MKIENSFTVDAPIERAWDVLTDIPTIAPCLPGAKLESSDGDTHKGRVKVKVGPVTAEYTGQATFVERDEVARRVVINGKGRDTRGAGNAQATITAQMTAVGDKTTVSIDTDLKVSGKVAQFGRGVMQDVSEKLLGQFAECVAGKLAEPSELTPPPITSSGDVAGTTTESTARPQDAAVTPPPTPTPSASSAASKGASDDDDAIDLLDVAGNAMWKRAAPVAGVVLALSILRILIKRRKSA